MPADPRPRPGSKPSGLVAAGEPRRARRAPVRDVDTRLRSRVTVTVHLAPVRVVELARATVEGTAELVGPGTDPDGPEVDALVAYSRAAAGEHPDRDEYRAMMVADRRVLMTMRVEKVYGRRIR